jgi:SARP family transcriptional regulator, regulator of embCAB operon
VQVRGGLTRVQLCGPLVVELSGRSVQAALPGRQGRLLFAYLVVHRPQPVPRDVLVDALWADAPPADSAAALNVVVSKVRSVVGREVLRGRTELAVSLPEPAYVDVELAASALHVAESAVAVGDWRRAWSPALTAVFVGRRTFLPEAEAAWAESWRRRLADIHARALECYAAACLELGGPELFGAERAARELVEAVPLRETGHLLLMRAHAARGNVAEALTTYERLRLLLRDELGVDPSAPVQALHRQLLSTDVP